MKANILNSVNPEKQITSDRGTFPFKIFAQKMNCFNRPKQQNKGQFLVIEHFNSV